MNDDDELINSILISNISLNQLFLMVCAYRLFPCKPYDALSRRNNYVIYRKIGLSVAHLFYIIHNHNLLRIHKLSKMLYCFNIKIKFLKKNFLMVSFNKFSIVVHLFMFCVYDILPVSVLDVKYN